MPNWCNNKLAVYGPKEDVTRFKEKAAGHSPWLKVEEQKENVLNFHSLVSIPPEVLSVAFLRSLVLFILPLGVMRLVVESVCFI